MVDGYQPKDRYIKNKRDEVINLQGELGNPTHTSAISVTQTAQAVLITPSKKTMRLTNVGTSDCYYGASGVTSSTGTPIYSRGESVEFRNVKDSFTVYVVCATGETTSLRRVEF